MNPTSQAVIAIRRPAHFFAGGSRSFIVWIDGCRAGKVKRGTPAEFSVEPGEHTVAVSMDWLRSRPLQVVAGPGMRSELAIGARSGLALKMLLPILLAALIAVLLMEGLRATAAVVDVHWWLRWLLFVAVHVALFGGYVLATSKFIGDYWALWTLGPAGTSSSPPSAGR